jgi:hypothetical protein
LAEQQPGKQYLPTAAARPLQQLLLRLHAALTMRIPVLLWKQGRAAAVQEMTWQIAAAGMHNGTCKAATTGA